MGKRLRGEIDPDLGGKVGESQVSRLWLCSHASFTGLRAKGGLDRPWPSGLNTRLIPFAVMLSVSSG